MMTQSEPAAALEELEWLRTFAARLAMPGDEDDLVQDTLLAAWQSPPQDRQASLRPWLATVARNRARHDTRARLRRERREQHVQLASTVPGPDVDLERARVLRDVLGAVDELPELDRKIIMRRFFNEDNATQIGHALGLQPATVRSRLRRSLAQLRSKLDERFDGRRDAWALVLVGPAASPTATTGASMMSIAVKTILTITITTTTAGLLAAGWWASKQPVALAPVNDAALAPAQEAAPELERTLEHVARQRWEQRRDRILATLAARSELNSSEGVASDQGLASSPSGELDPELRAQAWAGFNALRRACIDDIESDASGAISLSARLIGDPEVGIIFESVEIVAETVDDPELLECLTESMYAYLGDEPATAFNVQFGPTMPWPGLDGDEAEKQQRIFDAIVGAHHGEVAVCEREHGSGETGTAKLELTIGVDRLAETVRVVATDLSEPVVDCIVAASRLWKFADGSIGKTFAYEFRAPILGLDQIGR